MTDAQSSKPRLADIRDTLQHWLDYSRRTREQEGLAVPDDAFIITPPVWPTRGVLKEWIKTIDSVTTPPPAPPYDPNEGPIDNRGLVVLPDGSGVLPQFYNQWKCSQCGRDPRDVQFNGCGYSLPCGRVPAHERPATETGESL